MAQNPAFKYAPMFQHGKDETEYVLVSKDHVSVSEFEDIPSSRLKPKASPSSSTAPSPT